MARLVDPTEQRSLRQQAHSDATEQIRRALTIEQQAQATYRQRQRETADAIAVARAEGVPWANICEALGGINRSSAVLRLNVHGSRARAEAIDRSVPDIAAPLKRSPISDATLNSAPAVVTRWWNSPRVAKAIDATLQAVTDERRQQMLSDGTSSTIIVSTLDAIAKSATDAAFAALGALAGSRPDADENTAIETACDAVRNTTRTAVNAPQ